MAIYQHVESYTETGLQGMYRLMIKCWATGDQYLMPDFKYAVMVSLLHLLETSKFTCRAAHILAWPNIKLGFEVSAPESGMRMLSARNAVNAIYGGGKMRADLETQRHLGCLDGIPGASSDLFTARDFMMDRTAYLEKYGMGQASSTANTYGQISNFLCDEPLGTLRTSDLLSSLARLKRAILVRLVEQKAA